jgi:ubiquinone/menaquinone biosynthesis C-methylase UbiE/uncharacterized protein YbaR (Trm112 family)
LERQTFSEGILRPEAKSHEVNPELLRILCCPICKGRLTVRPEELHCAHCENAYPIVLGIPDLRVYEDPLIPLEDDYRKGDKFDREAANLDFADSVRYYWSLPTYPDTPAWLRQRFIHNVLTQEDRYSASWLEMIPGGDAFLDVGCGTAALLKVVQHKFNFAVGCDVAFRWLLIARKRLQEAGQPANLVACCADYLPFPDRYFSSVGNVSLLEHVQDAEAVTAELGRVTEGRGSLFAYTSNRFSLAPEPHVRVWGVGFMPRRWMGAYVRLISGLPYQKKRLLSCFEVRRFLESARFESLVFCLPAITKIDWNGLRGLERLGAHVFEFLSKLPLVRPLLVFVSPMILVVARRKEAAALRIAGRPAAAVSPK